MMMMILHHMRHGRQDNHATNHVRCTKTQGRAKQKAYRGQTKQNHIPLKRVEYNAYPAKQWKASCQFLFGILMPIWQLGRPIKLQHTFDKFGQLVIIVTARPRRLAQPLAGSRSGCSDLAFSSFTRGLQCKTMPKAISS
jgi:hypothetical protein